MKQQLWLLGEHIQNSPSPKIHNCALKFLRMDRKYHYSLRDLALEEENVSEETLNTVLNAALTKCHAFNVTKPYKVVLAKKLAEFCDQHAHLVGAINTVVLKDGSWFSAHNTDVDGLLWAWRERHIELLGVDTVIVGTGGAARAACVALKEAGARSIRFIGRNAAKVDALEKYFYSLGFPVKLNATEKKEDSSNKDTFKKAGFAVFTVSAMDRPEYYLKLCELTKTAMIYDVRYHNYSALKKACCTQKISFIDGEMMLLGQAISAWRYFFPKVTMSQDIIEEMKVMLKQHLRSF